MINVEVDKKEREIINEWKDLSLNKAIELAKLKDELPEKLAEAYDIFDKSKDKKINKRIQEIEDQMSDQELLRDIPKFQEKALYICSNIPKKDLAKVNRRRLSAVYNSFIEPLVFGCMYNPYNVVVEPIAHFWCDMGRVFDEDGKEIKSKYKRQMVKFYMPRDIKGLNEPKPMGSSQAIEWTESADLEYFSRSMSGGRMEFAANIVSILARPKDEQYEEKQSLDRAPHFMYLKMDKVWEVFFYFIERTITYERSTDRYFKVLTPKVEPHQSHRESTASGGIRRLLRRLGRRKWSRRSNA